MDVSPTDENFSPCEIRSDALPEMNTNVSPTAPSDLVLPTCVEPHNTLPAAPLRRSNRSHH